MPSEGASLESNPMLIALCGVLLQGEPRYIQLYCAVPNTQWKLKTRCGILYHIPRHSAMSMFGLKLLAGNEMAAFNFRSDDVVLSIEVDLRIHQGEAFVI